MGLYINILYLNNIEIVFYKKILQIFMILGEKCIFKSMNYLIMLYYFNCSTNFRFINKKNYVLVVLTIN